MQVPVPIILNPAARSTKAASQVDLIRALSPVPELHFTSGPGDATRIARQLAEEGRPLIVAAGGDGTVNEVLNGLCAVNATRAGYTSHCALGVLPMGTMNVFSLELGLPGRDVTACWQAINSGHTRDVDLWMANGQYFVQLAGIGLDAEIIALTPWEMKKKLGPLSYAISAVKAWVQKAPWLTIEMDGRPPMRGSVVLLGSGVHYGGPFRAFRNASNADGLLDVIIFQQLGYWEIAQLLRAVLLDGYENSLDLDYFQVRELKITADRQVPFELDGELAGETPVTVKAAPFKLKVAV
jgi:YegS/Rv2252/BmrU family lipid kinase